MTVEKKRVLKDITFSGKDSHIALVHKDQGGAANLQNYSVVLKGANFTPEFVEKMQKVQVTMETPEFLRRFFDMYYEESEILARVLGWKPTEEESDDWYEDYIDEKVKSIKILKNLHDSEDLQADLLALSEKDYLQLLRDQAKVEKALGRVESVKKRLGKETPKSGDDNNTADAGDTKENTEMTVELDTLQKSLADKEVELKKALERLDAIEKANAEKAVADKIAKVEAQVEDEAHREVVAKAALALDDADFEKFVDVLKTLKEKSANSDLFQEKGVAGTQVVEKAADGDAHKEAVRKMLQARFPTAK